MTWVTDSIFVAGGDFVFASWGEFQAQAGVSAVITVSVEGPLAYRDPLPWAALWLPVEDEPAYTLEQLALGVSFIEAALRAGRKVLLHGPKGVHRTRPLVAGQLMASGKSLARAIREVEAKPWLPPYKGDRAVLEAFAAAWKVAAEGADGPKHRQDRSVSESKGPKGNEVRLGSIRLVEAEGGSESLDDEADEGSGEP